jgi:hypothetical protein
LAAEGVAELRAQGGRAQALPKVKDTDGPSSHAVAPPAEDDGVDTPGQDPLQQHLSLFLMEQPTVNEVHMSRAKLSLGCRQSKGNAVKTL